MSRWYWLNLALTALLFTLGGCPRSTGEKKPPAVCKELGQQCELEPGKLGACAYTANCTGANCLHCQSQH